MDDGQDGAPADFVQADGLVYFSAATDDSVDALWRTDGTAAGTFELVAFPTWEGVRGGPGTLLGQELLFFVRRAPGEGLTPGYELWRTDGTPDGTSRVGEHEFDLPEGSEATYRPPCFAFGGAVWFIWRSSDGASTLWRTDGTGEGTYLVVEMLQVEMFQSYSNVRHAPLGGLGARLYFARDDGEVGTELWSTDGTLEGTTRVTDISPGSASSWPSDFVVVGGTLYFLATDAAHGRELWRTDGTEAGTRLVAEAVAGPPSGARSPLAVLEGELLFGSNASGSVPSGLWRSDGTLEGTALVATFSTSTSTPLLALQTLGGRVYFRYANRLWSSDGTSEGTRLVADTTYLSNPLGALGNRALLRLESSYGSVFWTTDGTVDGTSVFLDTWAAAAGTTPPPPDESGPEWALDSASGMRVFFEARTPWFGNELWQTDGTPEGTRFVRDLRRGNLGSIPDRAVALGSTALFRGTETTRLFERPEDGRLLPATPFVASHGCGEHGVELLSDHGFGSTALYKGRIYGQGPDGELWATDGTAAGTVFISAGCGGKCSGSEGWGPSWPCAGSFDFLKVAGDKLFMAGLHACPSAIGNEWTLVSSYGVANSLTWGFERMFPLMPYAALGDRVVFGAYLALGMEPSISDGTPIGTQPLADINPVPGYGSGPAHFVTIGDRVYFDANSPSLGRELWRTDGTPVGTTLVIDLEPAAGSSDPGPAFGYQGDVYFAATTAESGRELWRHRPSSGATELLLDLAPGLDGSSPEPLFEAHGWLYFRAAPALGPERSGLSLWRTDGTPEGTADLRDLIGDPAVHILDAWPVGEALALSLDDGVHGPELWRSDGTPEGTWLVDDIRPGFVGSFPTRFSPIGSDLYFAADDGFHGEEEWSIPLRQLDNCPDTWNPDQQDSDGDLFGDACDPDPMLPGDPPCRCDADCAGDPCLTEPRCVAGVCVAGQPIDCDDHQICTLDLCDDGRCVHLPAAGPCDDGDECTGGDSCVAGACVPGAGPGCDDANDCTEDSCDEGLCVHAVLDGACDDGDPCTAPGVCADGVCVAGAAMDCDDANGCTVDACAGGVCMHLPAASPCDDGDPCTVADGCAAGDCAPGAPLDCDDGDACTTDACEAGVCGHAPAAGPCDDGDGCTVGDDCQDGVCVAGALVDCDDGNDCSADACGAGECVHQPISGFCLDDDPCTGPDACVEGVCTAGAPLDCDDGNACTADGCQGGVCMSVPAAGACDDGDECTVGDACQGGACAAGAPRDCDDGDACTVDQCDPGGACSHRRVDACCFGSSLCPPGENCVAGRCSGGAEVVEEDADAGDASTASDDAEPSTADAEPGPTPAEPEASSGPPDVAAYPDPTTTHRGCAGGDPRDLALLALLTLLAATRRRRAGTERP
ncbi:MAG: hypothetical protein H6744_09165 [Deltaproteobacteria bacterium]|nr:hypothetical protein [Deltaproteobacteria bacterium]